MSPKHRLQTQLIHAGEPRPRPGGGVVLPIFQSSTFEYGGEESYHDLRYIRLNNTPNHDVLHAKLAVIEGAEAALVTASGMAAITTTLLDLLKPGDHLLAQDCLYGGTHDFVTQDLPELGVEVDFVAGDRPEEWEAKRRPTTKAFYLESMSNPLLQVPDVPAAVSFCKSHGLVSLIDNTFPSPANFRPAEHGVDLSLHSATKYMNGHSDIVAGAVIGRADLVERIRRRLNHFGGTLDPHTCFLLQRGLKTLGLRMKQHALTAQALAEMLASHPKVTKVHYPGLQTHPAHARARELFDGMSGMLSFELAGGRASADKVLAALELPFIAPSLGGAETLVTLPATTSHLGMGPEERARIGIGEGLVRVSVGLEETEDLVEDFRQAVDNSHPE